MYVHLVLRRLLYLQVCRVKRPQAKEGNAEEVLLPQVYVHLKVFLLQRVCVHQVTTHSMKIKVSRGVGSIVEKERRLLGLISPRFSRQLVIQIHLPSYLLSLLSFPEIRFLLFFFFLLRLTVSKRFFILDYITIIALLLLVLPLLSVIATLGWIVATPLSRLSLLLLLPVVFIIFIILHLWLLHRTRSRFFILSHLQDLPYTRCMYTPLFFTAAPRAICMCLPFPLLIQTSLLGYSP